MQWCRDGTLPAVTRGSVGGEVLGRTEYSTCSKARRLLTRCASLGCTGLRSPIPLRRGRANLIKADCCSYLGLGVGGNGLSLLSTPLCWTSFGPCRFIVARLRVAQIRNVRRTPRSCIASPTPTGRLHDLIAALADWMQGR
jgi:hypothetical protein